MTPNHVEHALRAGRARSGTLLNSGDPRAAAQRHGVAAGIHGATTDTVNRRIREGWTMVGLLDGRS